MEYRRFGDTYFVRIDRGEEVLEQLQTLARREDIPLARVEALGATADFTVGVYDVETKQFHGHSFTAPHEIVSLIGTLTTKDGEPYSHLHMGAANTQGSMVGGHLTRCVVSATCEMTVTRSDGRVERLHDADGTGLNLFRFLE